MFNKTLVSISIFKNCSTDKSLHKCARAHPHVISRAQQPILSNFMTVFTSDTSFGTITSERSDIVIKTVTHKEMVRLGIRLASGVSVSSLPAQFTRLRAPACAVWPLTRSSVQLQPLERSSRHARANPSSNSSSRRSTSSGRPRNEARALRRNIVGPFSVTRSQPMSSARTFSREITSNTSPIRGLKRCCTAQTFALAAYPLQ